MSASDRRNTTPLLLGALLALVGAWPLAEPEQEPPGVVAERVMRVVEARYVVPVDGNQLLHEGIDRILDPLDRHTRFFPPAAAKQFEQDTDGILFGIGIVLRQTTENGVIIERVLPGGSAHDAGFLAGDLVISVGGESTREWTLPRVSRHIRGELDSEVTIGVLRR